MTVQVGEQAPQFSVRDATGRGMVSLADFAGKPVVLAFYPLAFTGGWTQEMQGFVEVQDEFEAAGAQVLALSIDTFAAANVFATNLGATFPILGDWPLYAVARAYGVYNEERFVAKRTTFVIDREGIVRAVVDDPADFARHSREALAAVQALAAG